MFLLTLYPSGSSYLAMLTDFLLPVIRRMTLTQRTLLWFQQDGAPAHYAQQVRHFLDLHFYGQWIGRGSTIEWPPRSPDLTPLDFFLWGHLKRTVYINRPNTLSELKASIVDSISAISKETLQKVQESCLKRMLMCKQQGGGHFEQLL